MTSSLYNISQIIVALFFLFVLVIGLGGSRARGKISTKGMIIAFLAIGFAGGYSFWFCKSVIRKQERQFAGMSAYYVEQCIAVCYEGNGTTKTKWADAKTDEAKYTILRENGIKGVPPQLPDGWRLELPNVLPGEVVLYRPDGQKISIIEAKLVD